MSALQSWIQEKESVFLYSVLAAAETAPERRALFDTLAKDGASQEYLTTFRREFELIEEVLTGRECHDFLASHMSELQPEMRG